MCYYGAWAYYRDAPMNFTPDQLNGVGCTHIIYSFAGLDNQTYEIISYDPKLDIEDGKLGHFKLKSIYSLVIKPKKALNNFVE